MHLKNTRSNEQYGEETLPWGLVRKKPWEEAEPNKESILFDYTVWNVP